MFGSDPTNTPAAGRSRARAWRPEVPRAAAPLNAWVLVALLVLPLLAAAVVTLG